MLGEATTEAEGRRVLTARQLAFGAAAMGASNILKVALQLVMLPIMARLLGPGEFGLYALAMPTVTFLQMLADGGLGNSLSRESEANEAVWSTAFWALHGFGALLAGVVIIWSFALAQIAHQPRLPPLMAVLSISLVLLASSILPGARLMRRAQMAVGAVGDLAANIVGSCVGVGLALHHLGAWSLVAQYLATFALRTLILNLAAPKLPTLTIRLSALSPHLAVGGAIVGSKLSDFVGRLAENTLVGRFLGAPLLGAYSFGNQVPRFLCEAASNPVWSSLYVQALRGERPALLPTYYRLSRLLGLILLPSTVLVAVVAPQIVPLLLGSSWRAAIPVIVVVLPAYALNVIGGQSSALLYAYGRSDISFRIAVGLAAARVGAVALAPLVGLQGVAIGIGVACALAGCAYVVFPARAIGSNPWQIAKELSGALAAAAISGVLCKGLLMLHTAGLVWTLIVFVISGTVSLGVLTLVEGRRLAEDIDMIRQMLGRRPERTA
jgi:PST family polysaccharide transporter